MITLSIRQPWAWLIVNGHKDVENRSWSSRFRGPLLIHAGKGMTLAEYDAAVDFAQHAQPGIIIPPFAALERGGVVGEAVMTDCVSNTSECSSPWFVGDFGFVLRDAKPLPFRPCKGALGFFDA